MTNDEALILKGTLDLRDKDVMDALTPFDEVFMLEYNSILNEETMAQILASGYSRIPVYEGNRNNIKGLVFVKRLITIDPEENRILRNLSLRDTIFVSPDLSIMDMLNLFQKGHSHLAIISTHSKEIQRLFDEGKQIPVEIEIDGIIK